MHQGVEVRKEEDQGAEEEQVVEVVEEEVVVREVHQGVGGAGGRG